MNDKTSKNSIHASHVILGMPKGGAPSPSFLGTRGVLYFELIAIAGILLLAPLSREGLWLRVAVITVALLATSLYLRYGHEQRHIVTELVATPPEAEPGAAPLPSMKPLNPPRFPQGKMGTVPDLEDLNIEQDIVVMMPPISRREITVQVVAVRKGELNVVYDPPDGD